MYDEFDRIDMSKMIDDSPWILVEDFNEILASKEKKGDSCFDLNRL